MMVCFVFFYLAGSNGPQKFCIDKVGKETWLPRSHTWWAAPRLLHSAQTWTQKLKEPRGRSWHVTERSTEIVHCSQRSSVKVRAQMIHMLLVLLMMHKTVIWCEHRSVGKFRFCRLRLLTRVILWTVFEVGLPQVRSVLSPVIWNAGNIYLIKILICTGAIDLWCVWRHGGMKIMWLTDLLLV